MEALIVPAGLAAGYMVSHFSKPELKKGRKYFTLLQALIFGSIVGVACWPLVQYWGVAAGIAGFIFALKVPNPVLLLPAIAVITHYAQVTALAFLYTIPAASKEYPRKTRLIIAAVLFLAVYFIQF